MGRRPTRGRPRPRGVPVLPPPRCGECDGRDDLVVLQARPLTGGDPLLVSLCESCLRDRRAGWRRRWRVWGRTMPEAP